VLVIGRRRCIGKREILANAVEALHTLKRQGHLVVRRGEIDPVRNKALRKAGYPWAVIRFDQRRRYMQALDAASFGGDIPPFAKLISEHLSNKLRTAGNGDPKSNVDGLFRV
jgi:hypothetical protein